MADYDAATYGDRFADVYDTWYAGRGDTEGAVDLLASLAGAGPALELGIGTGRLALPLADRGIAVHGIDSSARMVEKLREKPGGANLPVVIGDVAEAGVEGPFSLVYVSELDLMAQLAGLRLRDRWADWRREPFTAASPNHVSVYARPSAAASPSSPWRWSTNWRAVRPLRPLCHSAHWRARRRSTSGSTLRPRWPASDSTTAR